MTTQTIEERKIWRLVFDALKEYDRWRIDSKKTFRRDDGVWVRQNGAFLEVGSRHHKIPQLYVNVFGSTVDSENELAVLWRQLDFKAPECVMPRPVLDLLKGEVKDGH